MTLDQYAREIAEASGECAPQHVGPEDYAHILPILQRLRDEVLEEAARACEEHTEHVDFGGQPQDHMEPPFRCNVAEAVRALKVSQ